MNAHPRLDLDAVLESGVRLSIVAALEGVDRADFRSVQDAVQISDSALSKQLARLEAAGYVTIGKERAARYARTWLALTPSGRAALATHLNALRRIVDRRPAGAPTSSNGRL